MRTLNWQLSALVVGLSLISVGAYAEDDDAPQAQPAPQGQRYQGGQQPNQGGQQYQNGQRYRRRAVRRDDEENQANIPMAITVKPLLDFSQLSLSGNGSVSYNRAFGFGLAAGFEFPLGDLFSFDPELAFVRRQVSVSGISDSFNFLHVTPMFRIWAMRSYLSLGLGPYFGYGIGSVTSNTAPTSQSYSAFGLNQFELGGAFSIMGRIPFTPNIALLPEFRFNMGLVNMMSNTSGGFSATFNDLQFLVGLAFTM